MSWAKVDDQWWSHPKVLSLSLEARGLWITALSWSCAQRRDEVPAALVRMVGGDEAISAELVDVGLWVSTVDGWRIHDWPDYQDRSLAEKRAEAGRKGGLVRSKGEAKAKQAPLVERSKPQANAEAGPVPSRPDHTGTSDLEDLSSTEVSLSYSAAPNKHIPDPIFEALYETTTGSPYGNGIRLTTRERGILNRAAKELRSVDATPEEIRRRAGHFLGWVGQLPTAGNLVTHWTRLANPQQRATPDQMAEFHRRQDDAGRLERLRAKEHEMRGLPE